MDSNSEIGAPVTSADQPEAQVNPVVTPEATPVETVPSQQPAEKPHSPSLWEKTLGRFFGGNNEKALVDPNSSAAVPPEVDSDGNKVLDIKGVPMHATYS